MSAILAAVAASVLVGTVPAHADILDVTCVPPSSAVVEFDPPLDNTASATDVSLSVQYGPCVSLSEGDLTSGSRTNEVSGAPLSCTNVLSPNTVTFTIAWNTGDTSTVTASRTITTTPALALVTLTGTVTSGLFAGDAFVEALVSSRLELVSCQLGLTTVDSLFGTVSTSISSV
ncbi:MAG: hypothetical protein WBA97_28050 [Actinophytocola sp.]|uniref:hypothetical protein n=1 Tax=Actinophytocola sp. TaxID=1872138 RepID=UPI003C74D916